MALRENFSGPVCSTDLVKVSKDTASRDRPIWLFWGRYQYFQ